MTRPENWPELLDAFLESRRRAAFAWGSQDCMAFAADGVATLTGVDILASYRGQYATEAEAEAILAAEGGLETLLATLATGAGLPEIQTGHAGRGDLVLVRAGNQIMAGLVVTNAVAVPGANGVAFVPTRGIQRAWRV